MGAGFSRPRASVLWGFGFKPALGRLKGHCISLVHARSAGDTVPMKKTPTRPRDPNQLAKHIVEMSTGDRPNDSPKPDPKQQATAEEEAAEARLRKRSS